jgi:BirA family transcriptional regulator, biotin operon repressor / biotin---[acetyl-CoA-carboxylase] ligase
VTTRDAVLSALREAGPAGVSGEALARELGVSRVAVRKHVSALIAAGYEIDAEAGSGYRLVAVPDLPLPSEVGPRLHSTLWTRLEGGAETGSTNDDLRELAAAGAQEGTVVLASRQTSGRGRLGRSWSSPEGGVYLSALLRPAVAPSEVAPLALVVALGVAVGLERLGAQPRLKWPNDVLLGAGKVAGILLEMAAEADRVERVVVGVGLNVHRPPAGATDVLLVAPDDGAPGLAAAYISDSVPGVRLAEVAAAALDGIAEEYARWLAEGFSAMRAEYEARSALGDREVAVRDLSGGVRAAGVVRGVDAEGRLLVEGAGGDVTPVVAGEVTLRGE